MSKPNGCAAIVRLLSIEWIRHEVPSVVNCVHLRVDSDGETFVWRTLTLDQLASTVWEDWAV